MKFLMTIAYLLFLTLSIHVSATTSNRSSWKLVKDEAKGVQLYKEGKFEEAYKKLSVTAKLGLKQSQYFMAFMYLKGQYIEQSVVTGLAWLGVAKESKIKEWSDTYDSIYSKLSKDSKMLVDSRQKLFIEQYGMRAQKVECETRKSSIRARKKSVIFCQKRDKAELLTYEVG